MPPVENDNQIHSIKYKMSDPFLYEVFASKVHPVCQTFSDTADFENCRKGRLLDFLEAVEIKRTVTDLRHRRY